MATFKELTSNDIKTSTSFLNQLIEIVGEDISSSISRKTYEHFVTGGNGASQPGVTSSLFHTVFDQDYTVQTANPIFDITVGLRPSGSVATGSELGQDANGKRLYSSGTLMMREKGYIYQQYAQLLLGAGDSKFIAPLNSTTTGDIIDNGLFINFKRLFHRDQLKRGTFSMTMFQSGNVGPGQTVANWDRGSAAATAVDCIDTTGFVNSNADASFTILIPTTAGGLGGTAVTIFLDENENGSHTTNGC